MASNDIKSEFGNNSHTNSVPFEMVVVKQENLDCKPERIFDESKDESLNYPNKSTYQSTTYQCHICLEMLELPEFLEIHQHLHAKKIGRCPYCTRTYQSQTYYQKHLKSHLENPLKCKLCPKIFFIKKSSMAHVAQHKREGDVFICEYCNKSFPTKKKLLCHERVHTNERPFKCDKCDKSFKQVNALKTHVNTHVEEKKFRCETCDGSFATASSLKRHIKKIHETGRSIECKLCQEEFLNQDSFFKHRMEKHPEVQKYFKICPICNEEFIENKQYFVHRKKHLEKGDILAELPESKWKLDVVFMDEEKYNPHMMPKDQTICCLCDKFVDVRMYPFHQNDHLGLTAEEARICEKNSKFTCKQCGATTASKRSAFRHMDLHLEKTYFCKVEGCKRKQAFTYFAYTRHYRNLHLKYKCKFCEANLSGQLKVKNHWALNCARSKKPREKKKVFICKWCKSTFTSSTFLMQHYSTHKKLNILYCYSCKKQFPRLGNFRKHMFVVHNQNVTNKNSLVYRVPQDEITPLEAVPKNKFYCALCKKSFYSRKIFEHHEKAHFKMQCKCCKKVFLRHLNYAFHVQNKVCSTWLADAMITELKDFKCTLCHKELTNRTNFIQHILSAHRKGEYQCKYCIAKFTSLVTFRTHLVAKHPKEQKYFCAMCDAKGFITYNEFMVHKRWHKNENHVKQVFRNITMDEIESRNKTEVKEEILSDEEIEAVDMPEEVTINENGQIEGV